MKKPLSEILDCIKKIHPKMDIDDVISSSNFYLNGSFIENKNIKCETGDSIKIYNEGETLIFTVF